MMLDSTADSEEQAERIIRTAEQKFARQPRAGHVRAEGGERRRQLALHTHHLAERGRLEDAPRPGRVGHRGGALVVPHAQRTRLRGGIQRRADSPRVRGGAQHGDSGRAGRTAGTHTARDRGRAGVRRLVARNRQSAADPVEARLHEGVGGAQGRRTGLRSAGREAAGLSCRKSRSTTSAASGSLLRKAAPGRGCGGGARRCAEKKRFDYENTDYTGAGRGAFAYADGEYLPPEQITEADIAAVEERRIVPVVGRGLYGRLLGGAYAEFVEEYLAAPLAVYVRLAVQPLFDVRTGPCGSVSLRAEGLRAGGRGAAARAAPGPCT